MMRVIPLIIVCVAIAAGDAWAVMPRDPSMVEGDLVRLGDVFDVTGPEAQAVVGRAPLPGRREVYDIDRLRAIARAHDLSWTPAGRYDRAVVERAGRPIDAQEIEEKILAALGTDPHAQKVELANRALKLYAATAVAEPITVRGISQDARSGYFSAVLALATGETSSTTVQVNGRLVSLTSVPVLVRRVLPGEVIKSADIATIPVAANQVSQEAVLDPNALVGQTPRRPLRERQPVLLSDVRAPILVTKGTAVTMILESPGLLLTAKGQALEDGAKGETIRIMNTQSNRTIEAVVTAAGTARVSAATTVAR
jgi:flagella basal body P-ring formation protein FlgA